MKTAAAAVVLAVALAGCGSAEFVPSAPGSAPPDSSGPSFACAVVTHNDDTASVNQFIAANGWDDNHASPPQLSVTVSAGSEDADVGSVTVAGYGASGQEIGSTDVSIGQVVTAGQSLTFTGDLPWFQVTSRDSWGNATVYAPSASSCTVVSWS